MSDALRRNIASVMETISHMKPVEHECTQGERLMKIEDDAKRVVPWSLGITLVSSAFGVCCLGFLVLNGFIANDKVYAAEQLSATVIERNAKFNRMEDLFETFRAENEKQHREMMSILLRIQK